MPSNRSPSSPWYPVLSFDTVTTTRLSVVMRQFLLVAVVGALLPVLLLVQECEAFALIKKPQPLLQVMVTRPGRMVAPGRTHIHLSQLGAANTFSSTTQLGMNAKTEESSWQSPQEEEEASSSLSSPQLRSNKTWKQKWQQIRLATTRWTSRGWLSSRRKSMMAAAAFCFVSIFAAVAPPSFNTQQESAPQTAAIHRNANYRGGSASSSVSTNLQGHIVRKKASTSTSSRTLSKVEQAVEEGVVSASRETSKTIGDAIQDLSKYMRGPKSDTLLLLLATALITPLCKKLGTSPILGFLAAGMLLGPNGSSLISGIHTTETLAELGIVFFLFEMGIELSFERLLSMRKDVFGLGLSQFCATALGVALVGRFFGLPGNALVVLGGGLALSSSAFVLQLLKDKNQLATRFGKAAFGILLFQDLAVVPLLVVTPILAGGGPGLARALGSAVIKAGMALGSIALAGRFVLNPLFKLVAQAQSQEAFLGVILLTVLSMSFMTEGLGLSNTLGAFLAGVLLSETKYRYQVEADIAPFRGVLLGLFFVTVGFEIDLSLIAAQLPLVSGLVIGILVLKALITTALSLAFGLSLSTSQQTGLILSQGGEFAFVAFGLARSLGILNPQMTKLMLTSVSLTMALTPFMATLGTKLAKRLEEKSDFTHYLGQDRDANEIKDSDDFVVVVGYGAVGKVVCDLLDKKFFKYVGLEVDPNKAIQARNAGLPVFYGDIGRQEVAEAFNVGKAKAVVVCIADKQQCNRAVIALRRFYPDLKIFARAADSDHASRLQNTLNVAAMVPILPEDNLLLTLPFGGAVMKALGVASEEVNAILETRRKEVLMRKGLDIDEEEVALLQLGVIPERLANSTIISSRDAGSDGSFGSTSLSDDVTEAARERREETLAKSPFVAEVIEGVCPDSADDEDDFEKDLALTAELLLQSQKASIEKDEGGDFDDGVAEIDLDFAAYDEEETAKKVEQVQVEKGSKAAAPRPKEADSIPEGNQAKVEDTEEPFQ